MTFIIFGHQQELFIFLATVIIINKFKVLIKDMGEKIIQFVCCTFAFCPKLEFPETKQKMGKKWKKGMMSWYMECSFICGRR